MDQGDFLSEAADRSERHLQKLRAATLFDAPGSVCVRRAEGEAKYRRLQGWMRRQLFASLGLMLLAGVFALLGLTGGGLFGLAGMLGAGGWPAMVWWVGAGLVSPVALLLLVRASQYDLWMRQNLPEAVREAEELSEVAAIRVSIEDPATFNRFKITPDDCAFLVFMPTTRSVLIEGVRYRQLIRGEDLRETYEQRAATVRSTVLNYEVGPAEGPRTAVQVNLSAMRDDAQLQAGLLWCLGPIDDPEVADETERLARRVFTEPWPPGAGKPGDPDSYAELTKRP